MSGLVVTAWEDDDDRCDDRREFEADRAGEVARSRSVPFGGDYIKSLGAVQDAEVPDHALDLMVPRLDARWPEPRLLWQTEVWHMRHRTTVDVRSMGPGEARWLLGVLEGLAVRLHAVAAHDEVLTTSSGLRRTYAAVGVEMIACLNPHVWLEATLLVRELRDRAGEGEVP